MSSWPTARLRDVATITRDAVDPAVLPPQTPYVGLEHIPAGGGAPIPAQVGDFALASTKFRFTERHLLFGKLRPNLGKVSWPQDGGVCSTDILPVLPGEQVDVGYLTWYLRSPEIVAWAANRAAGANLPRLSPAELLQLRVPLPPLEEQRRIAAILDQAEAIHARHRQILTHLDGLAPAIYFAIFGPPALWAERWPTCVIGDLARSIDYGTSAKAGTAGRWPILRMGNVTDGGRLDFSDLKYIDLRESEVAKYTVRRGDMLFNRTNSREKVGKSAVVRTDQPFALAGYLVRVRFEDAATAEFVSGYLASPHGVAIRRKLAKAAVNQANISASQMRNIAIAIPPTGLRATFAERLDAIETKRAAVERALVADSELFVSLQSRAFKGKL